MKKNTGASPVWPTKEKSMSKVAVFPYVCDCGEKDGIRVDMVSDDVSVNKMVFCWACGEVFENVTFVKKNGVVDPESAIIRVGNKVNVLKNFGNVWSKPDEEKLRPVSVVKRVSHRKSRSGRKRGRRAV